MIYTFLADISRLEIETALRRQSDIEFSRGNFENIIKKIPQGKIRAPKLDEDIIKYILSGKDTSLRRERCGAYLLLCTVMREMFGEMLPVRREKNGRPYFDGSYGVSFSISHSNNAVAVAISTEGAVGVDIEGEIDSERAARLEKRFFSDITLSDRDLEVTYIYCVLSENGEFVFYPYGKENDPPASEEDLVYPALFKVKSSDCFCARWTVYEATMKCGGGGFTSLPCLGMLLLETKADTNKICINEVIYYITTASSL